MPAKIVEPDWELLIGQPVRTYRNLNNWRMSLLYKANGSWRLAGHVEQAVLADVEFHVSQSSRDRAVRERTRNVHAYAKGVLLAQQDDRIHAPIALGYNPFYCPEEPAFFYQKGTYQPLQNCSFLVIRENQVFCSPDALGHPTGSTNVIQLPLFTNPSSSQKFDRQGFRCAA